MRIVFLGSGAFSIPSFEALQASRHQVVAVVTQPDREKGRGLGLQPPPLKPVALAHGVPVLQPSRIKHPEAQGDLAALVPELGVVVAYGQILPRSVIDIPPKGMLNVHASLLPKYRGAAPIQWAIAQGERQTGVTTMLIDEGLDTGPILLSRAIPIGAEETAPELETRLASLGAEVLLETVEQLEKGTARPEPQDHSRATLAPLLRKEDGAIDWRQTAEQIARRVRGFSPWPGTSATYEGRLVKVLAARPVPGPTGEPGTVALLEPEGIVVVCGSGSCLRLESVQPESRNKMTASAFAAGQRLPLGARFS